MLDAVNGVCARAQVPQDRLMWTLLIILLIVWAGLSILGFVIKGLFWLAVIGIVLFAVTLVVGLVRQRGDRS